MVMNKIDTNDFNKSIHNILIEPFNIKHQIPLIVDAANTFFANHQHTIEDSIHWGIRKLVCKELEKSPSIRIINIGIHYFEMIQNAFKKPHENCIQPTFFPNLKLQHEAALMFEQGEIIIFKGDDFENWRKATFS